MKLGIDTANISPTTVGGYMTAIGAALLFGWKAALPATAIEPSWCITVGAVLTLAGPILMGHGAADAKDAQTPPAAPPPVTKP